MLVTSAGIYEINSTFHLMPSRISSTVHTCHIDWAAVVSGDQYREQTWAYITQGKTSRGTEGVIPVWRVLFDACEFDADQLGASHCDAIPVWRATVWRVFPVWRVSVWRAAVWRVLEWQSTARRTFYATRNDIVDDSWSTELRHWPMYLDQWFACASVQSRRRNRYVLHNYGNNFMCHLFSDFTTVFK